VCYNRRKCPTRRPGSPSAPRQTTIGRVIRPTKADLAAAADRPIPDLVAPGLRILFVGINPGRWSGATGHHFAGPGNRLWPALHGAGLTPRRLRPDETDAFLGLGFGITNLVNRTTATAAELTTAELRAGAIRLTGVVEDLRPAHVAVLGIGDYRTAFERPKAAIGRQPETLGGANLWLFPNPSGLNAHYPLPGLIPLFVELREAMEARSAVIPWGRPPPGCRP